MLRLWRAAINSGRGLRFAFRSEQAFREEAAALLLGVPLALLIGTTPERRIELVVVLLMLMVIELLNTAIEKLSDRLTREDDFQIRAVKDMSSAAVGIMVVIAAMVWVFAIAERLGVV